MGEDTELETPSPARQIAGLIAANATLVVGVLVYMGWSYDTAFLGYFHLSPLDLNVGVSEYILRSLDLFSPTLIIGAVVIIAVVSVRPWEAAGTWAARPGARPARLARLIAALVPADENARRRTARVVLTWAGFVITGIALLLSRAANYVPIDTYLVLALLAGGPLMLTWPVRDRAHGRFPYALAVVVSAVCALWATSLYAQGIGTGDAAAVARGLPSRTAVALYSSQRLGLYGPGVTVVRLAPGAAYHYEYLGLRLLLRRSDTYYLLPVNWYRAADDTYVVNDSDMVRVVLYSGVLRAGG